MKNTKFDTILEAIMTKRIYSPRNVEFSVEFTSLLKQEYIKNRDKNGVKLERFHKAILFLLDRFERENKGSKLKQNAVSTPSKDQIDNELEGFRKTMNLSPNADNIRKKLNIK
jgi:hypothetical protein